MKKLMIVIGILGAIAGAYFIIDSSRELTQMEIEKNKSAAINTIRAIENFKQDNKKYPETAAELMPKYLTTLPECTRCEWKYLKSADGLEFDFGFTAYHYWYYNSKSKEWVYDSM